MFVRVEDTDTGHQFDIAEGDRLDYLLDQGAVKRLNDDERWPDSADARPMLARTDLAGQPVSRSGKGPADKSGDNA